LISSLVKEKYSWGFFLSLCIEYSLSFEAFFHYRNYIKQLLVNQLKVKKIPFFSSSFKIKASLEREHEKSSWLLMTFCPFQLLVVRFCRASLKSLAGVLIFHIAVEVESFSFWDFISHVRY
jgi:hypothetical protein